MASTRTTDTARAGRHPADLVETGNLLRTQPDTFPAASSRGPVEAKPERHDVVVVGAGQAGLSVGYHLKRRGIDHIILEGAPHVGDVWRNRWDSLRLFAPAKFDSLDGYRFPVSADRLNDQEVARLVKRTALAAGVRGDLPEGERGKRFAGHSLRAGLASWAEVDERYVQKQLGHTSAEMTRKYQRRRDRFRVNLTKASGL